MRKTSFIKQVWAAIIEAATYVLWEFVYEPETPYDYNHVRVYGFETTEQIAERENKTVALSALFNGKRGNQYTKVHKI